MTSPKPSKAARAAFVLLHIEGLQLALDGDRLTVRPASRLTDELRELIRLHRDDLVRLTVDTDGGFDPRQFPETTKILFPSEMVAWPSPDGRYAIAGEGASGVPVQDLDDGTSVDVGKASVTYGWTTDDQLVGSVDGQLAVCSPESGRCTTSPLPDGVSSDSFVRLPGFTYES